MSIWTEKLLSLSTNSIQLSLVTTTHDKNNFPLKIPLLKKQGSKERKERGMILEMKVKRPERPILFKQALFKKKNKVGWGRDWELSAQMQINNKMARVQNCPGITLGQKEMFVVGLGRFKVSWCVQSSVILNAPWPQWPLTKYRAAILDQASY